MKRFVPVVVAVGVVASGLLTSSVAAKPVGPSAQPAAAVVCKTQVIGVQPNGRLVKRLITNTRFDREKMSAVPLPFEVDYLFGGQSDEITDGYLNRFYVFTAGQAARLVTLKDVSTEPKLPQPVVQYRYRPTMSARVIADSGRYYAYGVDRAGNLMRWMRVTNNRGQYWIDVEHPKLVARKMGSLKTLGFLMAAKLDDGVRKDVLYGTTSSGALKQFQIPWGTPGKPKITTLKSSGFAEYTGLSLSWCDRAATTASIIAIDKTHNRARWYHLTRQFRPNGANLVRHALVAPGRNWRLHATF